MNIGLFLCRAECIGFKSVDVDALAQQFSDLASVKIFDNLETAEAVSAMLAEVQERSLEAVVLGACSPHYFQNTLCADRVIERLEQSGINPNRIAFANLKEQCALVHKDDPAGALRKAALMVEKALARVRLARPVRTVPVAPHRAVLVIGGTVAGIVGANWASRLGYRVYVLTKETDLESIRQRLGDMQPVLADFQMSPLSEFIFDADVEDVAGWCGDYTVTISHNGQQRELIVGGILVAVDDDHEWTAQLALKLHVNLDDRGNIQSRNSTTMATQATEEGILSVPPTEGPDRIRFQVEGACTAVTVLDSLLSQNEIRHVLRMTEVDASLCGACGTCVKTCAFHACTIDQTRRISVIDERRCKACGNCVTACPTGARDLITYPQDYLTEAIDIYAKFSANGSPRVLCLLCNGCGYSAADTAGREGRSYPSSVLPLRVACGGRVDTQHVLEAFWKGFDGVLVTVCREGHCHNIVGNVDMGRRVNLFRVVLASRNLDAERLRILEVAPHEGQKFAHEATRFVNDLADLANSGPQGA
ncbi:MAG: hydrogenase iron-sulfur subunit [Planctomycetes bacterium]|nr:hydrogenase iron-sulfur subunit [Planctomycetota bacterium]